MLWKGHDFGNIHTNKNKSRELTEDFYDKLKDSIDKRESTEKIIIFGDLNNENSDILLNFAQQINYEETTPSTHIKIHLPVAKT